MLTLLLTGSVAFIITFFALPAIIKIADAKRLFDVPDLRKIHKKPIASLGGVGMFTGFFIADLLFISNQQFPEFQYFYAAAIIIFFLGLKDDILIITASKKLIGQLCAAAVLIHLGGLRITSMHGLFGVEQLPDVVGLALTYTTVILIINAYNLIDGIDGLAGMLGLVTMAVFGYFFYSAGYLAYAMMAFSMGGSLMAFLIFNHHPAKIFMGDSGSLMLGLFNAILVLKFLAIADVPGAVYHVDSVVPVAIAILIIPLVDTLRVFSIRIFSGRSPFSPDRNHIHHLLLDKGLNHKQVTLCCVGINILFITLAYVGRSWGASSLLAVMLLTVLGLLSLLVYYPRPFIKHEGSIPAQFGQNGTPTRVVSINNEAVTATGN